jgi:23S rRNA pseudouridine2605 synthase
MTHPRFEVEKEYHALVLPAPDKQALHTWRTGVMLDGKKTAPAKVDILSTTNTGAWVRIVMREGRKRQIREIVRMLNYKTKRLIRVREGNLKLGDLQAGTWRKLRDEEIEELRAHIKLGQKNHR